MQFFPLSWTIVHPIDEQSPLYNYTKEDLIKSDAAKFLILLKSFDLIDTFSQIVHSRSSWSILWRVEWEAKFNSIFLEMEMVEYASNWIKFDIEKFKTNY